LISSGAVGGRSAAAARSRDARSALIDTPPSPPVPFSASVGRSGL
jgi:hypothetical protein